MTYTSIDLFIERNAPRDTRTIKDKVSFYKYYTDIRHVSFLSLHVKGSILYDGTVRNKVFVVSSEEQILRSIVDLLVLEQEIIYAKNTKNLLSEILTKYTGTRVDVHDGDFPRESPSYSEHYILSLNTQQMRRLQLLMQLTE